MGEDPDDTDRLEAEFPQWAFGTKWQETASGPGGRTLLAWRDGVTVTAQTVSGLRRAIAEAGG
jgi:hypothetical protein